MLLLYPASTMLPWGGISSFLGLTGAKRNSATKTPPRPLKASQSLGRSSPNAKRLNLNATPDRSSIAWCLPLDAPLAIDTHRRGADIMIAECGDTKIDPPMMTTTSLPSSHPNFNASPDRSHIAWCIPLDAPLAIDAHRRGADSIIAECGDTKLPASLLTAISLPSSVTTTALTGTDTNVSQSTFVRTPEQIVLERETKCWVLILEICRWVLFQLKRNWFQQFSNGPKILLATDGGSFNVVVGGNSLKAAGKNKGSRRLLPCDHRGFYTKSKDPIRVNTVTKKCGCMWAMWIESCTDGWRVTVMTDECMKELGRRPVKSVHSLHNHKLLVSVEEQNTNAKLRYLTAEQDIVAHILHKAGNPPAQIFRTLARECQAKGTPVRFTIQGIKNMLGTSIVKNAFDCSNLVEYLKGRQAENACLYYDFAHDEDGILESVFFCPQRCPKEMGQARCSGAALRYKAWHQPVWYESWLSHQYGREWGYPSSGSFNYSP